MAYIQVKNKSGQKVDLSNVGQKLKPFFGLVPKDKYPIKVTILKKKGHFDRSTFDLGSSQLVFKCDTDKQPQEEIEWVFAHEFAHFLCLHNPELKKTTLSKEYDALQWILRKVFRVNDTQLQEVFHDFLPPEVFANGFATMLVGKFYKRHSYKLVYQTLKAKFVNGKK